MDQLAPSLNAHGQPVGPAVPGWTPRAWPPHTPMTGRSCRLEPYDRARHLDGLFEAFAADDGRMWTYIPWGPFADAEAMGRCIEETSRKFQRFVIVSAMTGRPIGESSYMRHEVECGSVEVGMVGFSPSLQRTTAATEAMYLMMRRVFEEGGYRRYEWKCDALNAPSRAAALRLGFRFEGVFRQERVYKGRNRDTAWFSVLDSEWPELRRGFDAWLAPENFDAEGRQRVSLGRMFEAVRMAAAS